MCSLLYSLSYTVTRKALIMSRRYPTESNLFVLLVVATITAPFVLAVQPNCDPFESVPRTTQATCQGSTLEYAADGSVLTMTASLENCASANPESTVSVFFDELITPSIDPMIRTWVLSYSIMWSDPATNCVVDVTSTDSAVTPTISYALPNDTNGLNNSPLTNISAYALNQWYTRSFVIDGSALPSFRFGFTCASQTPGSKMQQVAFVKDITWKSGPFEGTVYNSLRSCVECVGSSPIEGSDCLSFGDESRWVHIGNIDVEEFIVDVPLTIIGNVSAYTLQVPKLLDIRGCLVPKLDYSLTYPQIIQIYGFRESIIVIRQDPGCGWPNFSIQPLLDRAFPNMTEDSLCPEGGIPENHSHGNDTFTLMDDAIVIYVPNSMYGCVNQFSFGYHIIIIVGCALVVAAGVIIGIVFGIRKRRQQQRAKQLDLEMERTIDHADTIHMDNITAQ